MSGDRAERLETIGLAGDGDEVDAIQALERHFAIILDYREASNWRTAGDVFASLLRALPANQRHREGRWREFAALICDETGADASRVGRDTLLLALPLSEVARRWFARAFGSRA